MHIYSNLSFNTRAKDNIVINFQVIQEDQTRKRLFDAVISQIFIILHKNVLFLLCRWASFFTNIFSAWPGSFRRSFRHTASWFKYISSDNDNFLISNTQLVYMGILNNITWYTMFAISNLYKNCFLHLRWFLFAYVTKFGINQYKPLHCTFMSSKINYIILQFYLDALQFEDIAYSYVLSHNTNSF